MWYVKYSELQTRQKVVQSLNSPFFLPPIAAEPGWAKRESRITCMCMLRTPPFFPPNRLKNHIWKYFQISLVAWLYKQQFLHSDWLNIGISVEFHPCHAKPHSICFLPQYQRILRQDLLTIETPTRTWKCTSCIMQMSCLYASDFPFKNFWKLSRHAETIRKNVWEKSNDAYLMSIRVQTTINYISIFTFLCFLSQY